MVALSIFLLVGVLHRATAKQDKQLQIELVVLFVVPKQRLFPEDKTPGNTAQNKIVGTKP
jgi:hypothetical protein